MTGNKYILESKNIYIQFVYKYVTICYYILETQKLKFTDITIL